MKITILQWNVWVNEKADHIIKLISKVNADVVCLQELTTNFKANPNRNIPDEIAGLGYQTFYIPTIERAGTVMGNGIFSKLPIKNTRRVYVQREKAEPGPSNENRIYIETELEANTEPLIIGTVHLSFTPKFVQTEQKQIESDNLISAISENRQRFVLAGDFNSLPDSYTINELDKILVSAGPDFKESSWTTKHFEFDDFIADGLNWRLDYVYTTPDIKVISSRTIPTEYSDHLPILVEIEI